MEEIAMEPNRAERRRRTPLWIALGLLILTIGLGAARIAPHSSQGAGGQDPGLALHFQAPGGGSVGFSGELDRTAVLAGGDGLVGIELSIRGGPGAAGAAERMPSDLVVVLDQSGSMAGRRSSAHAPRSES
jgi:hypothetical protein